MNVKADYSLYFCPISACTALTTQWIFVANLESLVGSMFFSSKLGIITLKPQSVPHHGIHYPEQNNHQAAVTQINHYFELDANKSINFAISDSSISHLSDSILILLISSSLSHPFIKCCLQHRFLFGTKILRFKKTCNLASMGISFKLLVDGQMKQRLWLIMGRLNGISITSFTICVYSRVGSTIIDCD
ncbi:hypothetical protein DERF_008461 [Dermatophagoides farinae]|uniref:Uncharacterized protein n=1 Tax=Dermatophagoides farinae TaxID=6954 RepID=A0A922I3G7_DERFA|nr:hypothetical protein DERF_008461 [Dermatophagoides farinae]